MSEGSRYREGFVTVDGYRMHYLEWGESGPQIVALHSMGMDAHGLDLFSESMSRDYRILAIDLLAHGDSDTPRGPIGLEEHTEIVRGVALERGFRKITLVGHSIGGMISMVYAAKHPEEVEKVVLVDIAPFDISALPRRRRMPPPPPESFESEEEALKYFRERYPRFTEEALQNRVKYALQRGPDGRLRLKSSPERTASLRGALAIDLWPFIEKIRAPTLLIRGSESQLVTDEAVKRMRELLKDFQVVIIEGATHMVPQDRPEEFERAVRNFLEGKT